MTQTARPASDITTTNWTTAPLFSKVNDNSDATTIRCNNGITTNMEVKLGSLTDPQTNTGHVVNVRAFMTGASTPEQMEFTLMQGGTQIALRAGAALQRTTPLTVTMTLTGPQADAITDYADLRIRVRMSVGAATEFITVQDVWMDVPDVPPSPISGTDAASADDAVATVDADLILSESGVGDDVAELLAPVAGGKTHVIVAGV